MSPRTNTVRVDFSKDHDTYLAKYLAKYCPAKEGRSGRRIYQCLVANEQKQWPWSVHHTWQSWRERYVKNSDHFDSVIARYQAKSEFRPAAAETRKRNAEPMPIEALARHAKRVKLDTKPRQVKREEEEEEESDTRAEQAPAAAKHTNSGSESKSTPIPPYELDARPSFPHDTNTNTEAIQQHTSDATTRDNDTLKIPSPPPSPRAPPQSNDKPVTPRPAKQQLKKRLRTPSDVFTSEPPSPRRAPDVSQVRLAPTTPVPTMHPRAPPRIVDSFHGQVLVNQKGHVPSAFHTQKEVEEQGEEEDEEKETEDERKEVENSLQWPPPRGRTVVQRKQSDGQQGAIAHHAFSQSQYPPRPITTPESAAKSGRPGPESPIPGRRAAAAQFLGEAGTGDGIPLAKSERREDEADYEPSKYPAPLASSTELDPFQRESPEGRDPQLQPRRRVPSPTKAARHPALARVRRQTIDTAADKGDGREGENGRQRREEDEQVLVPSVDLVALSHPSSAASARSRSSTGTGEQSAAPARPPRWSLPAYTPVVPWVLSDTAYGVPSAPESGSASGSSAGSPFRWAPWYGSYDDGRIGGRRVRPSTSRSMSRFTFTPSPARSAAAAVATNAIPPTDTPINIIRSSSASPSVSVSVSSLAPHASDVPLTASHGLASILAHMSANHGLALGVVENVYERVGSLSEADEVLRGMREAAEGFGEREIERRGRRQLWARARGRVRGRGRNGERRKAGLRYVVASEDGEGSEYSPPETSRAALWKQQAESMEFSEEGREKGEEGEEEADEEAEGRAVEEELGTVADETGDEEHPRHDFSQRASALEQVDRKMAEVDENRDNETMGMRKPEDASVERAIGQALVGRLRAQELEREMGKGRLRRDVVKQFRG